MVGTTDVTRDVLVSVRPQFASKILDGQKTVELRRRFSEVGANGAVIFIYSTSPISAVVGSARINCVLKLPVSKIWKEHGAAACISKPEFDEYFAGLKYGFAILLEGVQRLKKQVTAADLEVQFGIVPPQSYRYVTDKCIASMRDERFQTSYRYKHRNRA